MSESYNSNLEDLFRALRWRKLDYYRLEWKSLLMYKTLNGMTPDYLRSRFVYRDNLRYQCTPNLIIFPKKVFHFSDRSYCNLSFKKNSIKKD